MTINFYPAITVCDDNETGAMRRENVVPMEGDSERLCKEALTNPAFEGEAFEPNPEYIPFSIINMSNGNAMYILKLIGFDTNSFDECGELPIKDVFKKAHNHLSHNYRDTDLYVIERVFALREMARLGISRGATLIVWA